MLCFCFPTPGPSTQLNLKLNFILSFLLINSRKKDSARLSPSFVISVKHFSQHLVASGTMLPIPYKYESKKILLNGLITCPKGREVAAGGNRRRCGHQLVTIRSAHLGAALFFTQLSEWVKSPFLTGSFLCQVTGSSSEKEKVKCFDEHFASPSLARKTSRQTPYFALCSSYKQLYLAE